MAKAFAAVLIAFGLVLHSYILAYGLKNSGQAGVSFSMGLWLLSIAPYLIAASLVWFFRRPHAGLGAVTMPPFLDAGMFYSVFIHPSSSTAALGLLFMPLWNLFVFLPLGALIGWWYGRRARQGALL